MTNFKTLHFPKLKILKEIGGDLWKLNQDEVNNLNRFIQAVR